VWEKNAVEKDGHEGILYVVSKYDRNVGDKDEI
jgi:hypothetical protein